MEKDTFFARLGRALWGLIRFLVVLILLAVIGAAIWFGVPALYERYIQPLEANTSRLEAQIAVQDEQIVALQNQVLALQERLGRLETAQTETGQAVSDLKAADQAFEKQIENLQSGLEQIAELQSAVEGMQADLESNAASQEETAGHLDTLALRLELLSVSEVLTRARLYLVQNNYGLAKTDIERALATLQSLEATDPVLDEIRADLAAAVAALPEKPVTATDHLDLAWERLLGSIPQITSAAIPPTEETAVTATPSATPTAPLTVTPTATPTP